jgi:hypothetical protein
VLRRLISARVEKTSGDGGTKTEGGICCDREGAPRVIGGVTAANNIVSEQDIRAGWRGEHDESN